MNQLLLQRLLLAIPTMIGVSMLVFLFVRLQPGSPVDQICAGSCTPEQAAVLEDELGLDEPIVAQYFSWAGGVVTGDFGNSLLEHNSISGQLRQTLPVTVELGLMGIITSLIIALPVGVISAVRQDHLVDYVARSISVAMIAVPSFWIALLLITSGTKYGFWTPQLNYVSLIDDPVGNIKILWLPGLLLGISLSGTVMRLTRAQMLEVIREDYIRTARAKGLRETTVITRHAIRNAFIPVVTLIGLQIPTVLGGTVILETIFSVPGVGRYVIEAIREGDYPAIQAVNLVLALFVVFSNLAVDMSYSFLDPRIRQA